MNIHHTYFITEVVFLFQTKRSDCEIPKLFEVLESVTDIRDSLISKTQTLSESSLPVLIRKLNTVSSSCHTILDCEEKFDIVSKTYKYNDSSFFSLFFHHSFLRVRFAHAAFIFSTCSSLTCFSEVLPCLDYLSIFSLTCNIIF